jgi:hypothetical protein
MKPTAEEIKDIKKNAAGIASLNSTRNTLLKRYRDIYFMDNMVKPNDADVDSRDFKLTPSPSGRNAVVGMKRLLDTSELVIKIKDEDGDREADEIEEGLKAILRVSGEGRRGRIESDAALSAVLYGAVTIYAESIQDLLQVKSIKKFKRYHLEKKQKRSPFLLRLINFEESYPEWDEDMMISHLWKYKLKGRQLTSRWGTEASETTEYQMWDVFTPDFHVVWADGIKTDIFAEAHGLGCLPIFTAYSGGSDLFFKPEEQLNSFLYAKAKANLDQRENSILTTAFTNVAKRGTVGPLVAINPDNVPSTITIEHAGGMRYMIADAKVIDDQIIDPVIFQLKGLLDELDGQSTVQRQTLGENIGSGTMPFSSLSLLSNSGKLPLVDPQRALEQVFTDAFNHILYRIKEEGIKNEQIKPEAITDEMIVEVGLTAKLPQDSLRNAQVAQGLGDLVSDEWKLSELLQVTNTKDMQRQLFTEQMKKAVFASMLQNPQIMQQAVGAIMGQGNQPPQQPGQPGPDQMQGQQPSPEELAAAEQQAQQQQGQGQPSPEQMQQMQMMAQQQGQNMAGMGNVEGMPMTDSMTPRTEMPTK